jgi:hypothetical protein
LQVTYQKYSSGINIVEATMEPFRALRCQQRWSFVYWTSKNLWYSWGTYAQNKFNITAASLARRFESIDASRLKKNVEGVTINAETAPRSTVAATPFTCRSSTASATWRR